MQTVFGGIGDSTWDVAWAAPGPAAGPGVYRYHGFRMDLAAPRCRVELPALIATLVIVFAGEIGAGAWGRRAGSGGLRPFRVLLCGPQTRPHVGRHSGHLAGIDVTMAPWAAYALFGIPMNEIADRAVDLMARAGSFGAAADASADADPGAGRPYPALAARLAAARDWRARFDAMDEFLAALRAAGSEPAPQVVRATELLSRSGGTMSIASLAESAGWDPRRLRRAFLAQIGVRPKMAARIVRLQRALRLLGSGLPIARVAQECSYFDQAHLTNDISEMTGRSPRRLLAERAAMPPGPPNADRLPGELTSIVIDPATALGVRVGFLQDGAPAIHQGELRLETDHARG